MDEQEHAYRPKHPAVHLLRQIAGWLCIFMAVVGLIIPFMPHSPFLALGAILLAPYIKIFRRISAWVHKRFPRARPHLRRFRNFKRPWKPARTATPPEP